MNSEVIQRHEERQYESWQEVERALSLETAESESVLPSEPGEVGRRLAEHLLKEIQDGLRSFSPNTPNKS